MPSFGKYRPEHKPDGPLCSKCSLPAISHREVRRRTDYWREREKERDRSDRPQCQDRIIGIDGEGQGHSPHHYNYVAAVDEHGETWEHVPLGPCVRTHDFLEFVLSLPRRALIVGFAFQYDLTKALQDLPNDLLFKLFHEERRARLLIQQQRIVYVPISWKAPNGKTYSINFVNRMVTIREGKRSASIWDIFRFFRSKFTQALEDWKIADKEELRWMAEMKEKRGEFDKLEPAEVRRYCKKECQDLALLTRALIVAHEEAGLHLKKFYGAGSTASAFLDKLQIKDKRGETPEAMRHAVACGFVGGRFENSVVGSVRGLVHNYDISSAYPYHATFLPCLIHGLWEHAQSPSDDEIRNARLALVHWSTPSTALGEQCWGPWPVRARTGTIAFPLAGAGGWIWQEEYLQGKRIAPHAKAQEAWLYHTQCDCQPFAEVPLYYKERLRLGKDARGIPIKLGINSIYGKLAQSKGLSPPYQSWIWAGNITSGCRAQLIQAIADSGNHWDLLMFATDGIWSRKPLQFAPPRDTGTYDAVNSKGQPVPLGGWEHKSFDRGVFCVRPGIYFPLQPGKDELEQVRARGLGKKVLYEQWANIVRAYNAGKDKYVIESERLVREANALKKLGRDEEAHVLEKQAVIRFIGAKTGMSWGPKSGVKRSSDYGEWIPHDISVGFSPIPKREAVVGADLGGHRRLSPWQYFDWESEPYKGAEKDPEATMMALAELIAEEQPDVDYGSME